MPQWLLRRSVPHDKFDKALRFMRPVACWLDKLIKPRLTVLASGVAVYPLALLCIAVAATMVPLELVPFGNSTAGATLTVLGLGLIANDGAAILVAVGFAIVLAALVFWFIS